MPLLYALGQHRALEAIKARLLPGGRLFAFLDDVHVVAQPDRILEVYGILEAELWDKARIRIHSGKTQVWNRAGRAPGQVEELNRGAWRGGEDIPSDQRGIKILGTPLGHIDFIRATLREVFEEQQERDHQLENGASVVSTPWYIVRSWYNFDFICL